jgi:hypothetical protein
MADFLPIPNSLAKYFADKELRDILCGASQKLLHCASCDIIVFVFSNYHYHPENDTCHGRGGSELLCLLKPLA